MQAQLIRYYALYFLSFQFTYSPYISDGETIVTESHIDERLHNLTSAQLKAIDLLVIGLRDTEVADCAGVARETITRWRLYDQQFSAELNKRRYEVWSSCLDKIQNIFLEALISLERDIKYGSGAQHSSRVLDVLKLLLQQGELLKKIAPTLQEVSCHQNSKVMDIDQ